MAIVESPITADVVSVITVVSVVSVVSAFFEQPVASAIMAAKKKAVFVNAFIVLICFCLAVKNDSMSMLIPYGLKGNPRFLNFFLGYVFALFCIK